MVAALLWGGITPIGVAQIVPDTTLGSESSVLNPALEPGTTWIEGGATRSSALFHSFSDFNVNEGQRVYFANPTAIETIFSRVTGSNPSQIFGTLGVGGSADLFLINPQGILFGPNARLDISGSFTASTAESLVFGNGLEFSSVSPGAVPLLQVNVQPGLQGGIQEIQSIGELKAGKNLRLQGGTLEISGKLQAGGNLLLQGQTVNIFDQADRPLQLAAGGHLKLEGADQLSISALGHPDSFLSGGKLTLRSDQPVIGDTHFYSGKGGFRVETLAGALNRLESPEDPVIRTSGDVTIAGYIGSSLHIIAGGAVTIESAKLGDAEYAIALTGSDPAGALQDTITLSDGTPVQINGTARPTLDIRAGVTDPTKLASPGSISISGDLSIPDFNQNYYSSLSDYATPSSGDININGAVYLGDVVTGNRADNTQFVITNQWGCSPNCLPGNISISTIAPAARNLGELAELWIDSSGTFTLNGVVNADATTSTGNGGNINIISAGNLTINPEYFLSSKGLQGGNIRLQSTSGDVMIHGSLANGATILSQSLTTQIQDPASPIQGGNIELSADFGSILLQNGARIESQSKSFTEGTANLGSIILTAQDLIRVSGQDSTLTTLGVNGNAGNITLSAPTIEIGDSALISASTRGSGAAGNILLDAGSTGRIVITNRSELGEIPGGGSGSGDITIVTGDLEMSNSILKVFTNGLGKAGDILITASNTVQLDKSQLNAEVGLSATADGGNIDIKNVQILSLLNNSEISSQVRGQGSAGNITLSDLQSVTLQSGSSITSGTDGIGNAGTIQVQNNDRLTVEKGSKISTTVGKTGSGNAGAIVLNTNGLTVTGESSITSSTVGQGSAGSVSVTGNGPILIDNSTLSTSIEPGGVANPDLPPSRITLTADSVTLQNGAKLTSQTQGNSEGQGGIGEAGTIAITAQEDITLTGASSVLSAVGVNARGNAGGIQLVAQGNISLLEGSLLTASTRGQGDSGAIEITAQDFLAQGEDQFGFGSAILSTVGRSAEGDSGGIKMTLTGTVSLLNGALLDATTYGKGDSGAIEITAQDFYLQGEDSAGFLSAILSAVEATGVGDSGGVRLTVGNNVLISNGARLDVSTSGQGNSGAIEVTAQQVSIQGNNSSGEFNSNVLSKVESTGVGNSGGVNIRARESLSLLDGGVVSTTTFGQGNSGAIVINTGDLLVQGAVDEEFKTNLDNVQGAGISNIQSAVADTGRGNSGTINVTAQRVSLLDGGQLNANTFGQGDSGAIVINTQDFLAQGRSGSGIYRSGVQSGVGGTGIGNSQGISLTATNSATFLDEALLSASTEGIATERSNIVINTPTLTLDNRASITASTQGFQQPGFNHAGQIDLATATTTLAGGSTIATNTAGSGDGGEINLIASQGLFLRDKGSGIFSNTEADSTGNAGSIFIDPPLVDIRDGAGISVNSLGAGTGGNITLAAGDLTLDHNAFISASTVNSDGGQIFLTIGGDLLLLNHSYLSAAAGLGQAAGGNGGSITIDAAAILGFNNADISANAGIGNGGNITINSPILLGFVVENITDTIGDIRNNISASGQASAGTIVINNSVDPSKGLDPLAVALADLASQVRQSCDLSSAQTLNQFRIAGRGGLPSTPQDPLQSQATLADLRLLDDWISETPFSGKPIVSTPSLEPTLVPTLAGTAHWQWTAPPQVRHTLPCKRSPTIVE